MAETEYPSPAATESFALQRVVPPFLVWLGKAELAGLHGIKHGFLNDGRVYGSGMMYHDSLSFRRLLVPPTSRTARLPITYTPV